MATITRFLIILLFSATSVAAFIPWHVKLDGEISEILRNADGNFGVYVKSLTTGEAFAVNATRPWYLASAVKLAVATELYRQIGEGKLKFSDTYKITSADYRDGAGRTNLVKPGGLMTIRGLTEQMMIESDNAATDILIKRLGIDNINNQLKEIVPNGFSPISTLLDVRKLAYSEFNLRAIDLDNMDFMLLKKIKSEPHKLRWLRKKLRLPPEKISAKTLREAFENYYASELNSGTLTAYADLLTYVADNEDLMALMSRATTGDKRIVKGLPPGFKFAHKTGTQLARLCDMGIVYKTDPKKGLIITVCSEKFKSHENAEAVFSKIARAISQSGALTTLH